MIGDVTSAESVEVKVEESKPVETNGILRYCKFTDGSETHPGHTFKEDLLKNDSHSEVMKNHQNHQ